MNPQRRKAVFLDRDGVLNRAIIKNGRPYPPSHPEELEIPGDVRDALQSLKKIGFLLIGISNQPDVARGIQSRETVEAINDILMKTLPLEEIFVCYHDDKDKCSCRKPSPGLLYQAAEKYGIDLSSSFMVGDRWKDVEAGKRATCTTIMIDQKYLEKRPDFPPDYHVRFLSEAVVCILNHG